MRSRLWVVCTGMVSLVFLGCAQAATPTPVATPTRAVAPSGPTATPLPRLAPSPTAKPTPAPTTAPTGPKRGGIARHPQFADPPSWDPSRTHVEATETTKVLVFSKLFTTWSDNPKSCQSEAYPWAVQKWRWLDDTTTEFALKPGMKYHNKPPVSGREVVAQDMVPSFERYKKNLSFMAGKSRMVRSVEVVDKYTFRMKLESPWGGMVTELLADFYGPWLEPAEAGGPKGELWEQPDKSWIGSGAFMFDSWQPGVKWRMVRNPDYWTKGRPYLAAVEYPVIPDVSTRLAALRAGQVNLLREFNEELLGVAERTIPGLQVVRCPGSVYAGAAMLWMNNSSPPFDDVRVRRAVALAIDRESLAKTLYRGRASVMAVLPAATQYSLKAEDFPAEVRPFLEYNPPRAKQLLAEAGHPGGFDTVLSFTPAYLAPASMVTEAVAGMLGQVGIRARLNMMEYGRYTQTVLQAKYPVGELAITPRKAITPEDSHALLSFWSKSGSVNRSLVNDPEYDRLFLQFQATGDDNKRKDLARQLQTMVASKAYAVPLPMIDSTLTVGPGIHFTWVGNTQDYAPLLETAWME